MNNIVHNDAYEAFFRALLAEITSPNYNETWHDLEEEINTKTSLFFSSYLDTAQTRKLLQDAPAIAERAWPGCMLLPFFEHATDNVLNGLLANSKQPTNLPILTLLDSHNNPIDWDDVMKSATMGSIHDLPLPGREYPRKLAS